MFSGFPIPQLVISIERETEMTPMLPPARIMVLLHLQRILILCVTPLGELEGS